MVNSTSVLAPIPSSFAAGMRAASPIVLGYLPIGFALGVLASTAGFTVGEVGLMSALVYAGSSQFIAAGMFAAGAGAPAIISTTFLVNLRHLLMSTALVPSLRHLPAWQSGLISFGITDETFAISTAMLQGRTASAPFMAGLHLACQASWFFSTIAGAILGEAASNTSALGLDFALPAMFVGLLMPHLRGDGVRSRAISALVGAGAALFITVLFPGSGWSVIGATLIAAAVGVMLR